MTKKKISKTDEIVLSLSREEANRIGLEVERLIENEMSYIVNKYIRSYANACKDTFGWDEEDLLQHMRILMWKGVATYQEGKNAKMTTYLSSILGYRMANLSKRIKRKKHQMCKLSFFDELAETDETTEFDTPEHWMKYAERFRVLVDRMNKIEEQVLVCHLIEDMSLKQMEKKLSVRRPLLVSALKTLKEKMQTYMGEYYEEPRLH